MILRFDTGFVRQRPARMTTEEALTCECNGRRWSPTWDRSAHLRTNGRWSRVSGAATEGTLAKATNLFCWACRWKYVRWWWWSSRTPQCPSAPVPSAIQSSAVVSATLPDIRILLSKVACIRLMSSRGHLGFYRVQFCQQPEVQEDLWSKYSTFQEFKDSRSRR